jgi:uncharacterized protein YajQ (UPF0234 family)
MFFNLKEYIMPSFDVVSETNTVELRNAVDNALREMSTRFDFRGVESSIELKELTVTLRAESDFQVRQLEDLFRNHCSKRNLDASGVDIEDEPVHSGKFYSLNMTFKQGIDQPVAKDIIKLIKDSKLKVQASIQGDKIRITGKKRDDLQDTIAFLKKSDVKLPLQYENFRD